MADTKIKLCDKFYLDKAGKQYRNLPADPSVIVSRQFTFSNGEVRLVKPGDFPKTIAHGMLMTGLGYVGSASLNNSEGSVEKAVELFDKRIAAMVGGKWAERTGAGGLRQDSLIVAAILAVAEAQGKELDPDAVRDRMSAIDVDVSKLSEEKGLEQIRKVRGERRAAWLKRADVNAAYEKIKAARAIEKAKEAAEAKPDADEVPVEDLFATI